jgi:adenylate kinase
MKIVVLLGAPGSGKGTIAGRLVKQNNGFAHLSSGDLLREAVNRRTHAGVEAEYYMKRGELVPDSLIGTMINDYVVRSEVECTLLLDGFPRTLAQAVILDQVVASSSAEFETAVLLEVDDAILFERIAGRRTCPQCGAGYHIKTIRPAREGVCDVCGATLVTRKDDNPETVRTRLDVYRKQTMPLINYYDSRGQLRRIDGVGDINNIVARVRQALI